MNMIDLMKDCEQIELSHSDLIHNFNCGDQDMKKTKGKI